MENLVVRIGMEVHAQLATKSKLFCKCSTQDAPPNSNVCPVCLGLPGVLPVLNRQAVFYAVKASVALNCKVQNKSYFARKHYFYPDLPKGYQITQYDKPLALNGYINIKSKKIRIRRVHLEEDAGRLIHERDKSYVDFNRCGIPLIEIVTEPDISSAEEAVEYLNELRLILKYIGVSEADMEKGNFRCEPNVSVAEKEKEGVRTEIKNLNSFKAVRDAIAQAIEIQKNMLLRGEKIKMQTMLWDERKKSLVVMRMKEEEADYRYFKEPDLPMLLIEEEVLEKARKEIPELPEERRKRYVKRYGLKDEDARILAETPEIADFFEKITEKYPNPKRISKFIINDLFGLLREHNLSIKDVPVSVEEFASIFEKEEKKAITKLRIREFIRKRMKGEKIELQEFLKESKEFDISKIINDVLSENKDVVEKYKKGKETVLGFLIGQVMKRIKGKGDPVLIKSEILKRLR